MLQKRFVIWLVLMIGLGVLSACSNQVVPAPAPSEAPAAGPATASLTETAAMPEAEATIEQPAPEVAQPSGGREEMTTEPDGQSGEMGVEQDDQPAETLTVQIDATSTATAGPGQDRPVPACDGELEPTASNAEGPYYKGGAPERAVLVEPDTTGTRLLLTGQVLTTDCQPVAGALLDFWQANDQGEYDNVGYTLRGRQFADEMGRYRLETIVPARYPGRPPHIHVKVNAPGGPVLTTQIYFEGQPGNEGDGLIRPSLIVPLADTADGGEAATFNFVLISEKAAPVLQEYPVPPGSRPHDVAPAPDGSVWYTAQGSGELGRLDPDSGETRHIALGAGSAPHGVIVGPDGAPWVTDGGLNAIVRVDPGTEEIQRFPLPEGSGYANLNTATFDQGGVLWFTGQSGVYGRLDPEVGQVEVFQAPRGRGPYGIATSPDGVVYYASLAGSHVARLDLETGAATNAGPGGPARLARFAGARLGERVEWRTGSCL
jgi:protocatechuate 3,4-dioxygenase beta subunit/sugar lactone lactonase YvrE